MRRPLLIEIYAALAPLFCVRHLGHAIGVATLTLLVDCDYLVFRNANARMHSSAPLARIAVANILAIVILSALAAVLLKALRGTSRWPVVELLLAGCLPPILLARNAELISWPPHPYRLFLAVPGIASWHWPPNRAAIVAFTLCWMSVLWIFSVRAPALYERLLRYGSGLLAGFGLFGVLVSAQLVRAAAWSPRPAAKPPATQIISSAHRRIVWILLDELSHRQVFEQRASTLSLPHFDALRHESTLYTQVRDAGLRTETVMPSLFLGTRITDVDYSASDQLLIKRESGQWETFDPLSTVFAGAFHAGFRVGIAGWWNPYCQMAEGLSATCYWTASVAHDGLERHRAIYDDLHGRAIRLLNDQSLDFVFLHLPVPHPPAFYDRHTGRFNKVQGGSYLDSLALADRTIGDYLAILRASARWPETAVIVDGDHSWRIDTWRKVPGWTAEDESAAGGKFDPRPVLLVHRAGQREAVTIDEPFPLIQIHDILAASMFRIDDDVDR